MNRILTIVSALGLAASVAASAQDSGAATAAKPTTLAERAGYAIGLNMGTSMKEQEVELDVDALVAGLRDGLAGKAGALTQEEIQATMTEFQQGMMAKQQAAMDKARTDNVAKGDTYRAEFAAKEGVQKTESGLLYQVLTAGTGARPAETDTVTVHYRGMLVDGTSFDSSYERNEPATFPVSGVIQGWQEIVQLMPVGSKWQVVIPPALAYGDFGSPPRIGPGSTLVFEIELLSIEAKTEAQPAAPTTAPAEGG